MAAHIVQFLFTITSLIDTDVIFFEAGFSIAVKLLLRRTLVLHQERQQDQANFYHSLLLENRTYK
jgi:hypothetical protein